MLCVKVLTRGWMSLNWYGWTKVLHLNGMFCVYAQTMSWDMLSFSVIIISDNEKNEGMWTHKIKNSTGSVMWIAKCFCECFVLILSYGLRLTSQSYTGYQRNAYFSI